MSRKSATALADNSYFALIREFPLKPITSQKEFRQATAIIDRLVERGFDNLTADEDAYLDVLSSLTAQYEDQHDPIIDKVTEAQMLAHLIEEKGVTQRAVAKGTGLTESMISDLLSGRRPFNRNHIDRLAKYFKVSPAVFFRNS